MTEFYRAFEDKNRGSRELIKERLQVYLPFIRPLTAIYPKTAALDLGCGRGEWLELLSNHKFDALGIDIDEQMLSACYALTLNVTKADALSYLKRQPNETYAVISAFHVVEHISFDDLKELVEEALRVLKPGGLLIMETPNPENIVVAGNNFYLDPTHIRPVPQQLLSFTAEFAGFTRVKILRLQEDKELKLKPRVTLSDVVGGVSPDYAVIAQKEAPADIVSQFDPPFAEEFGVSLQALLARWQFTYDEFLAQHKQNNKVLTDMEVAMNETRRKQSLQEQNTENLVSDIDGLCRKVGTLDKVLSEEVVSRSEFLTVSDEIKQQLELVHSKSEQTEVQSQRLQKGVIGLNQHLERAWLLLEKQQQTGHEVTKEALDCYAESLHQMHKANSALQNKLTEIETLQNRLAKLQAEATQYRHEQQNLQTQLADIKVLNNQHCAQLETVKAELADAHASKHDYYTELQATKTELADVHASNHYHYTELQAIKAELNDVHAANHNHWQLSEKQQQQIDALLSSWSWRLTWPLRFLLAILKTSAKSFINALKWPIIWLAKKLVGKILANDTRAALINKWLMHKLPFVHRHLRQFALHHELLEGAFGVKASTITSKPIRLVSTSQVGQPISKLDCEYYFNSDSCGDGNTTVDQVLTAIRQELTDYRERT